MWVRLSAFLVMLCVAAGLTACNPTPVAGPTATAVVPTATIAATTAAGGGDGSATPVVLTELGEVQRIAFNGFEFRPVVGYSLDTTADSVSMEAPDAETNTGPGFFLTGGYAADFNVVTQGPEDVTQPIMRGFLSGLLPVEDTTFFPARQVAVHGVAGTDMDFCVDSDFRYCGRITVLQEGNQIFTMIALSPPERWNDEIKPLYQDVIQAVRLFTPER